MKARTLNSDNRLSLAVVHIAMWAILIGGICAAYL
jgi:hypothetical protein